MKRLCTICARGGSKGVKNKNTRLIAGKPLIAHSIIQAKTSGLFQYLAVSSDCENILKIAQDWGADHVVHRPQEMASDTAAKVPAIRHCFQSIEKLLGINFEILVDLDATSPLRNIQDIEESIDLLESKNVSNVITGCLARRSPYFNLVEETDTGIVKLSKQPDHFIARRQDTPNCYDLNASIYVWKRDALLSNNNSVFYPDTRLYVMPENRSIDIDSELDFQFVEFLMERESKNEN